MTKNVSSELGAFIRENDNFLLLAHEKPDGDALGSLFGLFTLLRENGKKADAYLPEPPPARYTSYLPEGVPVGKAPALDSYSWIVCLDTSVTDRIGIDKDLKGKILTFPVANIDHHPDNKLFGKLNFVVPEAAATAEILFRSSRDFTEMRISQKAASFFLIGLLMDTGGFRYDNTKSATFRTASDITAIGVDYSGIINSMFFSQPLNFIRMEAELVSKNLRTAFSGKYAWAYLSDEILAANSVDKKDTETVIESLRQIQDVVIAAILYRKDDGFKISLRSKDKKYPVANIARFLNGGGHELAAGGFIRTSDVAEAEKILLSKVGEILGEPVNFK